MSKKWLYNKTVVISGASGGLGFEIAKTLIKKFNCKIIGIGRNEQKLLKNIEKLGQLKSNFTYKLFDVRFKENWQEFVKYLTEENIAVDILINNAGFMLPFTKLENVKDSDVEEIINTNLKSYVYSTKILLPILKKSSSPAIFNVSSAAGLCPVVGESMYCLTKFGVRGFTESLYQEYKKQIFVGGIYPGFIKTNLMDRMEIANTKNGIIDKVMMPVEKASKKIVKRIAKRKRRTVIGIDGRSMHFLYRLMPHKAPSIIRKVFKISKLDMFKELFED